MADHNLPTLATNYENFLAYLSARIADIAKLLDADGTTPSNLPSGAKRWNPSLKRFEEWSGTAWSSMTDALDHDITFTPTGSISATTVRAALEELDFYISLKQPVDATLTALAALTTAANKLFYATGSDSFATTDITAYARTLIAAANEAAAHIILKLSTKAEFDSACTDGNFVFQSGPATLVGASSVSENSSTSPAWSATQTGTAPVQRLNMAGGSGSSDLARSTRNLGTITDGSSSSYGYILLARKYVGTALAAGGFSGRFFVHRGGASGSSRISSYTVNARSTNIYEHLSLTQDHISGAATTGMLYELCYATVAGVEYIALRRQNAAAVAVAICLDGLIWDAADATLPKLVADADVTSATTITKPSTPVLANAAGTTVVTAGMALTPTRSTVASGSTINLTAATSHLLYDNASTAASLTINLASSDLTDGQTVSIATRSAITALTIGGTTYGAPSTLAAGGFCTFIYSSAASAWFRKG